jgi:type I restriction enzyme, S subunit
MSITMERGLVPRDSVDRRVDSKLSPEAHLLVRQDDIAYNMMRMWQGVLGRAEYNCLVSPAYIVMTPGDGIRSAFAEYLLSTNEAIAWFKRLSFGIVEDRLRLYAYDLIRVQLRLPTTHSEQEAIVSRLESVKNSINTYRVDLRKLQSLKSGLMHDLLTGRVRVPEA